MFRTLRSNLLIPAVCSLIAVSSIGPALVPKPAGAEAAPLTIVKAEAVTPTTFKVTLNQKLSAVNPSDFELDSALGDWYGLDPKLTNNFTVKTSKVETNADGNTVVVLETEQTGQAGCDHRQAGDGKSEERSLPEHLGLRVHGRPREGCPAGGQFAELAGRVRRLVQVDQQIQAAVERDGAQVRLADQGRQRYRHDRQQCDDQ
ncbi:hypothetical protein LJK87_29010 [Paenibacillus sp. P25]|nr:hypothetical protein LJK87_29010 [Paenibacillus sp. P25]